MWASRRLRAPYALSEVEVTAPLAPIHLSPEEGGAHVLLRHCGRPMGRIWLTRAEHGQTIAAGALDPLVASKSLGPVATLVVRDALLGPRPAAPTPSLTVAVCTRDRAGLLRRCLAALVAMRDARAPLGPAIDILVVDNAPSDGQTCAAAAEWPGVRYAVEPVPGLNFGRNRALAETDRPWLAYIDDDAVVDRFWLDRLAEAIATSTDTGAFTGPVLPLMLETEAQLRFERAGGFSRPILWEINDSDRWGDPIYPANAGRFGTGACMAFATDVLRAVGGFDEALDTGPPLPGGGDIDMFYRVIRAGHRLVYLPGLVVHHEHRRDMTGLRKQYHSWGLSMMALLQKNRAHDPDARPQHIRLLLWWTKHNARRLLRALLGRGLFPPDFVLAEIWGGLQGYCGAYQRSQRRIAIRKREHAR